MLKPALPIEPMQDEEPSSPTVVSQPSNLPPREQFSLLMREHHRELLLYARAIVKDHHVAQDLVQESLVAGFRRFEEFDRSRDFGKWMRGIIRHKCLDWFRKQKRSPFSSVHCDDLDFDLSAWQATRQSGKDELFQALVDCIAQLPEALKDAVIEFYLQENSGSETAEKLEISSATVRKRLERARLNLHQCLTQKAES